MKTTLRTALFLGSLFAATQGYVQPYCWHDSQTNNHNASLTTGTLLIYEPSTVPTPSTSSALTFTTYDVHSGDNSACKSAPLPQTTHMNSDYVANQEVVVGVDTRCNKCDMPAIITKATGLSYRYGISIPWRTGSYGNGVATSQKILGSKVILYSGLFNTEQRSFTVIKTAPPALNGKSLYFISTMLDYESFRVRIAQAQQLVNYVKNTIIASDSTASVVVGGDFNAASDDGMYSTMKTLFKNVWEVAHGVSGGPTFPNPPAYRFDHLWMYTPSSVSATVQSAVVVATYDSVHRPFTATINFATSSGSSSGSCSAISITQVTSNSYVSAGTQITEFTATIKNNGSTTSSQLVLSIPSGTTISQVQGLLANPDGTYSVSSQNLPVTPGKVLNFQYTVTGSTAQVPFTVTSC